MALLYGTDRSRPDHARIRCQQQDQVRQGTLKPESRPGSHVRRKRRVKARTSGMAALFLGDNGLGRGFGLAAPRLCCWTFRHPAACTAPSDGQGLHDAMAGGHALPRRKQQYREEQRQSQRSQFPHPAIQCVSASIAPRQDIPAVGDSGKAQSQTNHTSMVCKVPFSRHAPPARDAGLHPTMS